MTPIPIVLDCDPGHDDAIALLLAAAHPALDLRAITTVAGNGQLDKVTLNARRICTLARLLDVPIAAGAAGQQGGDPPSAEGIHGESALDGPALPDPVVELDPRTPKELIAAQDEPVTLIATGPLTNVPAMLEQGGAIREVVWMGGSTERGNTTPYAEFNAWVDPAAAAAVLASGVPFTVVGLNLTHQALATDDVLARIGALGTPLADTVVGWLEFFGGSYRDVFGFAAPPVHDPCAVALVAEPDTVRCADAFVAVETEGTWTRGATVVDLDRTLGQAPNARVALELQVERFWDLVIDAVAQLGR